MADIKKLFETFNKELLDSLIKDRKTYIHKKFRDFVMDDEKFDDLIMDIWMHDYGKFSYNQTNFGIFIIPDAEFMKKYEEMCIHAKEKYNDKLNFYLTIRDDIHLIDFDSGIPLVLRGCSVSYNLYLMVINHNNFISSNKHSSKDAYNLWYNLLQNKDLYGITSNTNSVLINKRINNIALKNILDKFKGLEYDDELLLKINEIYGSMVLYQQGN